MIYLLRSLVNFLSAFKLLHFLHIVFPSSSKMELHRNRRLVTLREIGLEVPDGTSSLDFKLLLDDFFPSVVFFAVMPYPYSI